MAYPEFLFQLGIYSSAGDISAIVRNHKNQLYVIVGCNSGSSCSLSEGCSAVCCDRCPFTVAEGASSFPVC